MTTDTPAAQLTAAPREGEAQRAAVTLCDWASCTKPAVTHITGVDIHKRPTAWDFCRPHNTLHREFEDEDAGLTSDAKRQMVADLCALNWADDRIAKHIGCAWLTVRTIRRDLGLAPRALASHGTHAAFALHKRRREILCAACIQGEREYQAARHLRRKAVA